MNAITRMEVYRNRIVLILKGNGFNLAQDVTIAQFDMAFNYYGIQSVDMFLYDEVDTTAIEAALGARLNSKQGGWDHILNSK